MTVGRAWRALAVWSVLLLASSWSVLEGPRPTLAGFADAGDAAGAFSVDFPPPPCLLWAVGSDAELRVSGSGSTFAGCMHGNNVVKLVGSGHVYRGQVRYVGSLEKNDQQSLEGGSAQVALASAPFSFDIAEYREGAARAQAAGAAFTSVAGGTKLIDPPDGVYHFAGDGSVRLDAPAQRRLTLVAEGSLTLDLRGSDVGPYQDGLLGLAGGASVDVKGEGEPLRGAIYAPGARIHFTSGQISLTGYIVGNEIDFSTQGGTFEGAAPSSLT